MARCGEGAGKVWGIVAVIIGVLMVLLSGVIAALDSMQWCTISLGCDGVPQDPLEWAVIVPLLIFGLVLIALGSRWWRKGRGSLAN